MNESHQENADPQVAEQRSIPIHVESVIIREIRLPLVEPFTTATGTIAHKRVLLIEAIDKDGTSGWGECVALEDPGYLPETIDSAWLMIRDWVAPLVLGRDFAGPTEVSRALDENIRGNSMAKAAVEMTLWALASEKGAVPLSVLLGGTRSEVATGIAIGIQEDDKRLLEKVEDGLAQGYAKIKIKIKPGADLNYIRPVCEAVGSAAKLMVDANCAYSLADALHLKEIDALGLMMIEQPLAWDDLVMHAQLQRELSTPICLDESITTLGRAADMITLKSGRIINIKPGKVGGFAQAIAIHDLCAEAGIPVWCGGMLESGIGRAHNVALASLPNFSIAGDLSPSRRYWAQDIVSPEWEMDDRGMVKVPRKPGLGVEIDRGRIDRLTVRREDLSEQ